MDNTTLMVGEPRADHVRTSRSSESRTESGSCQLRELLAALLNGQPFSSFWTKALYASTLFSVTCVHMQVIPACHEPVAEGMDLTLYKAASAASLATLALFRFAGGAFFLNYIIKASKFYGTQHAKGE